MDHPGASSSSGSVSRPPESSEQRRRPSAPQPTTPRRARHDEPAEDEAEEEERAAQAGAVHFQPPLWNRLQNPPKDRPTVDMWEIKLVKNEAKEGEILTLTFTCDGEKYTQYIGPRGTVDYHMRANCWIPRHDAMWATFRTRIFSIPKHTKFNRIIIHSTPDCSAEDCILEFMYIKKWSARLIDFTIHTEWTKPHHLRRLIHMFKPMDIVLHLGFGPYPPSAPHYDAPHTHLGASLDSGVDLEKDFKAACAAVLSTQDKNQIQPLYTEAARGKLFGCQMLRTLCSLRTFVGLMVTGQMCKIKGMTVRKFIVNYSGPSHDKICPRMLTNFKEMGAEETNKRKQDFVNGEKLLVCVRSSEMKRQYKYSIALPAISFKMQFGNDELLSFTKTVPHFHCLFRTAVDERGVVQLATEWYNHQRQFEEIQIQVDKAFEPNFLDSLNADTKDAKRIRLTRNPIQPGTLRHILVVDKERLASRHLHLRVMETK